MSETADKAAESAPAKSAPRPEFMPPPGERNAGGPRMFGGGQRIEKSISFGPSLKRLLARLRPEALVILAVVALAISGIFMGVLGPNILGRAPTSFSRAWSARVFPKA